MQHDDRMTECFEANRDHLHAVAYRMLGSRAEAEDAVQDAWLRLNRADTSDVDNLAGWLTTVVARICLDLLRTRASRRERPLDESTPAPAASGGYDDPEQAAVLADSIGPALLVVLDTLSPAERLAFVLHDMFAVSFDEIAPIVDRSPQAARQLASRARRRVQGATPAGADDLERQREVVAAFLSASRTGNFDALLAVLDPDVVLRADDVAVQQATARRARGAPLLAAQVRGATAVADAFAGRAEAAQLALIDGAVGAAWAPGGVARAAFAFTVSAGRVVAIELIADPDSVRQLEVRLLDV